jgi:hypothetical protein
MHLHVSTIMRQDMALTQNVFNEANSAPFDQMQILFKLEYTKFKKNCLLKEIKAEGKM